MSSSSSVMNCRARSAESRGSELQEGSRAAAPTGLGFFLFSFFFFSLSLSLLLLLLLLLSVSFIYMYVCERGDSHETAGGRIFCFPSEFAGSGGFLRPDD